MNKTYKLVSFASLLIITIFSGSLIFAYGHPHSGVLESNSHTHEPQTEFIPINEKIGIEKTVILMHVPSDNTLPWGFVEGKIANHVPDYSVIIQIYDEYGDSYHFAQTDVEEDGSYEYRFRVRNVDDGQVINVFEGDYFVKIFKVVYHSNDSSLA